MWWIIGEFLLDIRVKLFYTDRVYNLNPYYNWSISIINKYLHKNQQWISLSSMSLCPLKYVIGGLIFDSWVWRKFYWDGRTYLECPIDFKTEMKLVVANGNRNLKKRFIQEQEKSLK
jgi:hypothetical protein